MTQKSLLQSAGDGTAVPAGYIGENITQYSSSSTSVGGATTDFVQVTLGPGVWFVTFNCAVYAYENGATYTTQVFPTYGPTNANVFYDSAHMTLKKPDSFDSYNRMASCMNSVFNFTAPSTVVKLRRQDNNGTGTKNIWGQIIAVRIA